MPLWDVRIKTINYEVWRVAAGSEEEAMICAGAMRELGNYDHCIVDRGEYCILGTENWDAKKVED